MMHRRLPAALLTLCTSALAQTQPFDAGGDMLRSTAPDKLRALTPVAGSPLVDRTTVNPITPGMRPATLRREGSYVLDRGGRVTASADGKTYQFEFDAGPQTPPEPPVVLLPNVALMTVQNTLRAAPAATHFTVTGVVTEYLGRNYLLLQRAGATPGPAATPTTAPSVQVGVPVGPQYAPVPPIGQTATAPPSTPSTPAAAAAAPSSQPMSASDMLNDMLRPGSADRLKPLVGVKPDPVVDRATGTAGVANARPMLLRREGTYVIDRTGRITRSPDGKTLEFTFEADQQTLADPPMVLLPDTTLMLAQDARKNSSRDARFRVTGVVTEYGGRNYLLLQKAILLGDNAGLAGG